jgi:predicted dehydrogenase
MLYKICIIGCGSHSRRNFGPSLKRYLKENKDNMELSACCDLDLKKLEDYRRDFNFKRAYCSYHDMLEKEKPHAVFVIMPLGTNEVVGEDVLKAGAGLFVEKPPAKNVENMLRLIKVVENSDAGNQVGFNRRYCPMVRKFTSVIHEEGVLQCIRYDMLRCNRTESNFATTAIHGIDAVRYIMKSNYRKINFFYQELPRFGTGVCNIYMDCVMENETRAFLNFCPVTGVTVERAVVNADDTTYFLNIPMWNAYDAPGRIEIINKDVNTDNISGETLVDCSNIFVTGGFYAECKAFLDSLINGQNFYPTLKESLQSVEIMQCMDLRENIYDSGYKEI